ncbi:MAG TPA: DUF6580 family putative transport protein [Candidatus Angelobacter sp.]|nr:DUF6580 family putative transport protein [Candidatus Angelobacter sp.]
MLAYLFVVVAVAIRVLAGTGAFATHGFTPLGASLLFFGSRMPRKQFWLPVVLFIGSDLYLNYRVYHVALTWDQTLVWAWYVGACFIGVLLENRVKPLNVLGAGAGSAISFFLVSNFGVWAAGYLYPRTWAGLVASYTNAIPFFRNGLISDLFFASVFFSIPVLLGMGSHAEARRVA